MKKINFLVSLLVFGFVAMAMADSLIGQTLKVKNSDCVVTFFQGPFGGGGEGSASGDAILKCGTETMKLSFLYQPPELSIYTADFSVGIEFAHIGNAFMQIQPNGVELSE